jgi:quercetin 2,3-dioxygenase
LWVNLPKSDKFLAPRYQDLSAERVTLLTTHDGGALVRLIAGDIGGHVGPGSTHTPIVLFHATLNSGARLEVPWRRDFNALAYVLNGRGSFGAERYPAEAGNLAVFGAGDTLTISADEQQESRSPNMDVLVLGGLPIREPIAWAGPFVMNTRTELVTAYEDFQAGRLGQIPHAGIGGFG